MAEIYKRNCDNCGRYYEGYGKIYCSQSCRMQVDGAKYQKFAAKARRKGIYKKCTYCGKEFYVHLSEKDTRKFCSQTCSNKANAKKLSKARTGSGNPMYKKKPWNKEKRYKSKYHGKNHWAWRGGRCREKYALRRSSEWREWREEVFKRDKYKSVISKLQGDIIPHHIKLFAFFEEDRFKIENGITLFKTEHKRLHKRSYELQPNCEICINKIKMEPIIVELDQITYRCHICDSFRIIDFKGGEASAKVF